MISSNEVSAVKHKLTEALGPARMGDRYYATLADALWDTARRARASAPSPTNSFCLDEAVSRSPEEQFRGMELTLGDSLFTGDGRDRLHLSTRSRALAAKACPPAPDWAQLLATAQGAERVQSIIEAAGFHPALRTA